MSTHRVAPTSREPTPRERVVYAAVQHIRSEGPAAASLRAIVKDADAPWGSLQHYFPGGKEQIVCEALAWAGEFAAADVATYLDTAHPTPGGLFTHLLDSWSRELSQRDYARGCPVAASTLNPSDESPAIAKATHDALDRWLTGIETALVTMGVDNARSQARVMLSMLEGAIIVSRVQKDTTALSELREFAAHFDAMARNQEGYR